MNIIQEQKDNLEDAALPKIRYDATQSFDDEPTIIQDMHGNTLHELYNSKIPYENHYNNRTIKIDSKIIKTEVIYEL